MEVSFDRDYVFFYTRIDSEDCIGVLELVLTEENTTTGLTRDLGWGWSVLNLFRPRDMAELGSSGGGGGGSGGRRQQAGGRQAGRRQAIDARRGAAAGSLRLEAFGLEAFGLKAFGLKAFGLLRPQVWRRRGRGNAGWRLRRSRRWSHNGRAHLTLEREYEWARPS